MSIRLTGRLPAGALKSIAVAAATLLLYGCAFVGYDPQMVETAVAISEFDAVAELGPTTFDHGPELLRPQLFQPLYPLGSAGYLYQEEEDAVTVYHVDGSESRLLRRTELRGEERVVSYVGRVVNAGSHAAPTGASPVGLLIPFEDGFQRLFRISRSGEVETVNLAEEVAAASDLETPLIVGAYFYAESDGTREGVRAYLALLAREGSGSTFREVRLSVDYLGSLGAATTGTRSFPLPEISRGRIVNGSYVYDPVHQRSYLTLLDEGEYRTISWDFLDPGDEVTTEIEGIVSYAPPDGGVAAIWDGALTVYEDAGGTAVESRSLGNLEPAGLHWTVSGVEPLFALVGLSRGVPSATLNVEVYR